VVSKPIQQMNSPPRKEGNGKHILQGIHAKGGVQGL